MYWFKSGFREEAESPKLTVLNFSAGKQSSAILWMVLMGKIPIPENFIVLRADPGMENSKTYQYAALMESECSKAGIELFTAPGPNLYEDLVNLSSTDKTRIDNPPYWTKDEKGKVGRLRQKCTKAYKITPMDRFIRQVLEDRFGISKRTKRLGEGVVEKWIGFTLDEAHRIKPPSRKYIRFRYPLIDLELSRDDTLAFYHDHDLPVPPRSVCNACFANGLDTLKEMFENRPEDWKQAVEVDKSVRDLSQIGIHDEIYVSHTAESLEDLAANGFTEGVDKDDWSCDSGYCFI